MELKNSIQINYRGAVVEVLKYVYIKNILERYYFIVNKWK